MNKNQDMKDLRKDVGKLTVAVEKMITSMEYLPTAKEISRKFEQHERRELNNLDKYVGKDQYANDRKWANVWISTVWGFVIVVTTLFVRYVDSRFETERLATSTEISHQLEGYVFDIIE